MITVKDLMKALEELDPEMPVMVYEKWAIGGSVPIAGAYETNGVLELEVGGYENG